MSDCGTMLIVNVHETSHAKTGKERGNVQPKSLIIYTQKDIIFEN
jgi:hypothetical protein